MLYFVYLFLYIAFTNISSKKNAIFALNCFKNSVLLCNFCSNFNLNFEVILTQFEIILMQFFSFELDLWIYQSVSAFSDNIYSQPQHRL